MSHRVQRRRAADDGNDSEEQGSSQPRRRIQHKVAQARRAASDAEDENEDEEDGDDDDVDERAQNEAQALLDRFVDQPLPKDTAKRLTGLVAEWQSFAEKLEPSFSSFNNTAAQLEELDSTGESNVTLFRFIFSWSFQVYPLSLRMSASSTTLSATSLTRVWKSTPT